MHGELDKWLWLHNEYTLNEHKTSVLSKHIWADSKKTVFEQIEGISLYLAYKSCDGDHKMLSKGK